MVRNTLLNRKDMTILKIRRNYSRTLRTARSFCDSSDRRGKQGPVKVGRNLEGFRVKVKKGFDVTGLCSLVLLQLLDVLQLATDEFFFLLLQSIDFSF